MNHTNGFFPKRLESVDLLRDFVCGVGVKNEDCNVL